MWDAGTWLFKLLGKPFLVNIWMETPITTVVPAKRPARQEEPKPGVPAKPAAITCWEHRIGQDLQISGVLRYFETRHKSKLNSWMDK